MGLFDVANSTNVTLSDQGRTQSTAANPAKTQKNASTQGKRNKPQLSPAEIRAKVQNHFQSKNDAKVSISAKARNMAQNQAAKAQKLAQDEAEKVEKGEEAASKGPIEAPEVDIKNNDPKDPITVNKLKDALSSGAISFSEKERQVLGKILGEPK